MTTPIQRPPSDKRLTAAEVVGRLRSGMTLGIGGWGSRRKPMAFVREILRSDLSDLTLVSYGGPEVGILCRAGRVSRVISAFVTLDSIPLEPNYRLARQTGSVAVAEWDEGMFLLGLQAAAWRVPFLPTRAGLGSDILSLHPDLRTVTSPYPGPGGAPGEELLAVPALELDAALIHAHRADICGNAQLLGEDPFMDDLFVRAAQEAYVSCERIIPTEQFSSEGPVQTLLIHRIDVAGVVEAPGGAGFTECPPDYPRNEAAQAEYVKASGGDDTFAAWLDTFTTGGEAA